MREQTELTDEEINRLIHEKVMGECWHEFETTTFVGGGSQRKHLRHTTKCKKCGERTSSNSFYCSSDMYAWLIVRKLEKDGWIWTLSKNQNVIAASYDVRFFLMSDKGDAPKKRVIAIEESLPKAICLAALSAIGEE